MHPILFRIPIPSTSLPIFWVLLVVAGLGLAGAVWQLVTRNKQGAAIGGLIAVAAAVAAFKLKGQMWDLSPVPIYSYGVMLGLSLVVGWYLTLGLAERDGLPKETMANNYVVTAVVAVLGSRVLYILTNLHEFDSIGSMFAMRRGGLVAYGGFLGGFVGSWFYLKRHRIALLPWADVAVPSLASGLMITRIGCYLFGCDFGQPLAENAPGFLKTLGSFPHWAKGTLETGDGAPAWVQHVRQRGLSEDAPYSLPVHPTQLYESLVGAMLLVLLLTARKRQKFRGQIFLLFTFSYGVCRFLLEILRDDAERGSIPPALSEHILLPLCLGLFAVGYVVGFSKMIENLNVRRATQVLSFVPAIALYFALKPESFATSESVQLSTSQAVALSTGFAAALAFATYYPAALAHPEAAMALHLPPDPTQEPPEAPAAHEDEDEGEDEDAAPVKPKAAAKVAKKKKKKKRPVEESASKDEGDEAAGEEAGDAASDDEASKEPKARRKTDEDADEA